MFVFPTMTAPASRSLAVMVDCPRVRCSRLQLRAPHTSKAGTYRRSMLEAAVVLTPSIQKLSLEGRGERRAPQPGTATNLHRDGHAVQLAQRLPARASRVALLRSPKCQVGGAGDEDVEVGRVVRSPLRLGQELPGGEVPSSALACTPHTPALLKTGRPPERLRLTAGCRRRARAGACSSYTTTSANAGRGSELAVN